MVRFVDLLESVLTGIPPCPKCGSNVNVLSSVDHNYMVVRCRGCKFSGPLAANRDQAISRWERSQYRLGSKNRGTGDVVQV